MHQTARGDGPPSRCALTVGASCVRARAWARACVCVWRRSQGLCAPLLSTQVRDLQVTCMLRPDGATVAWPDADLSLALTTLHPESAGFHRSQVLAAWRWGIFAALGLAKNPSTSQHSRQLGTVRPQLAAELRGLLLPEDAIPQSSQLERGKRLHALVVGAALQGACLGSKHIMWNGPLNAECASIMKVVEGAIESGRWPLGVDTTLVSASELPGTVPEDVVWTACAVSSTQSAVRPLYVARAHVLCGGACVLTVRWLCARATARLCDPASAGAGAPQVPHRHRRRRLQGMQGILFVQCAGWRHEK